MQVADSTIRPAVVVPPETPAVRPVVRDAPQGRATERDRRDLGREERRAEFRAALNGASGSIDNATSQALAGDSRMAAQQARPEKRPTGDHELSGAETADILSASRNTARGQSSAYLAQPFLAATQQYARQFFAVGGTFATRGETLEITA